MTLTLEHNERVTRACALAINHAALLCDSMREFCEKATTQEALDRPDLVKIKNTKRELEDARMRVELNLLLAVEKLYRLHGKQISVSGRDFQDLLLLCWNGVAERLDRENHAKGERPPAGDGGNGPLQTREQTYHHEVVLPLIQQSFERLRIEEKDMKNELKKENKAVVQ